MTLAPPHLPADDPQVRSAVDHTQELARMRDRGGSELPSADRLTAYLLGFGNVAVALALAILAPLFADAGPAVTAGDIAVWGGLVALYTLAFRTEFESSAGSAVPTQTAFVGMLLTMPLPVVPLALVVAHAVGTIGSRDPGALPYRLAVNLTSGWHALGPVTVLMIAAPGEPALEHWPVYLLALAAQFTVDVVVATIRCAALGAPLRALATPLAWTFAVDAMLALIGLAAVIAAGGSPALLLFVAAPLVMVRLLARDRSAHLEQAVTLGTAFTEVQAEARVDSMTGIANRRGWDEALGEFAAGGRPNHVVMADLDFLKRTNDRLGHQAGDELIRAAAHLLVGHAPAGAVVARLGGDEFGLAWTGDGTTSREVLDAIRSALDRQEGGVVRVSMSLGAADVPPFPSVQAAVIAADEAASRDKLSRRVGRDGHPRRRSTDW